MDQRDTTTENDTNSTLKKTDAKNSDVSNENKNKKEFDNEKTEESKDIPKISLAKFFDLIGQIDIVLRSETSLRLAVQPYPFDTVAAGEWIMTVVDSLEMSFEVFTSGDDLRPWLLTRFTQIKDYSNFDEYIEGLSVE